MQPGIWLGNVMRAMRGNSASFECAACMALSLGTAWACRRDAPPGFRASPRAVFAVTAIRLQSLTPSRLRRCALRLPPGESPTAIPAARCLAPLDAAEPAAPDRPGQRPAAMDGALANTLALAAAGCANACRPQRWRFLPVTSQRTVHGQPARHRYGASTPRLKTGTARCGRGVLACRRVVDLARVSGRAGAAFMRGCRAGPISFRSGSAQGVLVSL